MNSDPETPVMAATGERMVPEASIGNATFCEHVARYRFAASFAGGRRVLDIACGEGYGTNALAKAGAASVIGIDISEEACAHARKKYGVDARVGDAASIDLPDASVDLVVSFETLEHVPEPAKFAAECRRVLAPGGFFIVSTPNRDVYRDLYFAGDYFNAFHCSEMTIGEFRSLLDAHFSDVTIYSQYPTAGALVGPAWLARLKRLRRHIPRRKASDAVPPSPGERADATSNPPDDGGPTTLPEHGHAGPASADRERVGFLARSYYRFMGALNGINMNRGSISDHTLSAILKDAPWYTRRFSPFHLRKMTADGRELPVYLVAIARV